MKKNLNYYLSLNYASEISVIPEDEGGGYLACWQTNGRPIEFHPTPKDTPKWGAKWKQASSMSMCRARSGSSRPRS